MNQKEKLGKVTAKGARFSRIGAMSTGSKIAMGILALIVLVPTVPMRSSTSGAPRPVRTCSEPTTSAVTSSHAFSTADVSR